MKPVLVREHKILNASINFDETEYNYFPKPFHFHPEFELTLIVKSFGQRQIGDNIENYSEGDLVLIGSNLPHVWKNDKVFHSLHSDLKVKAIAVKFLQDFAGNDFLSRPEIINIKKLLIEKAPFGVKLEGYLRNTVEQIMRQFPSMDDSDRFIKLIEILNLISKSDEYKLLASLSYRNEKANNTHRINYILDYIMDHYQEDLTLDKIASHVHMNKNAFCRFLKKGTCKNLFTLIHEVRIGKACQHLIETDLNILQVCYACGFNNVSNFNKTFKKITGSAPSEYRKKMRRLN